MKIIVRKQCNEFSAQSGGALLYPLLRWKSLHVIHHETTTAVQTYSEFCRWAETIGFDAMSIKSFEAFFNKAEQSVVKANISARLTGFEFATDGYNLMSLLHFELTRKDVGNQLVMNFLSQFAFSHSTVQTAPLVGQRPNEFAVGLLHTRLPQRLQTSRSIWILTDGLDLLTSVDQQPLLEVG